MILKIYRGFSNYQVWLTDEVGFEEFESILIGDGETKEDAWFNAKLKLEDLMDYALDEAKKEIGI